MSCQLLYHVDPDLNMARFYRVEVLPDLFGDIIVERRWGRIGGRGAVSGCVLSVDLFSGCGGLCVASREGAARIPRRLLKPTHDCLKKEAALWCSNGTPREGPTMTVHKQSVSFTDAAFAFARELVEAGEYPNVSAAVSGEMARAKAARDRERTLLEAEVQRRLALPPDQWEPVAALGAFTSNAREHLARLKAAQETSATS